MMSLKLKEEQREEGFTLIELLVVVIIIGILAAIAIPVFLNQRESAWQGTVESDVRNAAIEVETYATRNAGNYPASTDAGDIDATVSTDVDLYYEWVAADGDVPAHFLICGEHENIDDESVTYNSNEGGLGDGIWDGNDCTQADANQIN